MTTKQETRTIAGLLRDKRGDQPKARAYRALNVDAGTYNTWESGMYIPRKPEHLKAIAEWLGMDEQEVVWISHVSRREKSLFRGLGLLTYSIPDAA